MKQWYPENKVIANSIATTLKMYYVYRLTLSGTDFFYIGSTGDLSSRLSQHIVAIESATSMDDTPTRMTFHFKGAQMILERFGNEIPPTKDIRPFMGVHIIAIVDNLNYALLIERTAIADNKGNPNCLNIKGNCY